MGENRVVGVLFVCSGNICRSPSAEGVFRSIDSAGLGGWHVGEMPDPRARAAARKRGIHLSGQEARKVVEADFGGFDYVIGMDRKNRTGLLGKCPAGQEDRVHLFLDFVSGAETAEIPDPYYDGDDGFGRVLDLIEAASRALHVHIRQNHLNT